MKIAFDELRERVLTRQRVRDERRAALRAAGVSTLQPQPVRPRSLRAFVARVLPWRRPSE